MNHEEAVRIYASEVYFLGVLSEAEKESFEAHMFDCRICAEEIKELDQFVNDLRKSVEGDPDLDPRFHTAHAAAAYVLGDLEEKDRVRFEAHMAECQSCCKDVNRGVRLLANLHRAIQGETPPGKRRVAAFQFSLWFQLVFNARDV